MTEDDARWWITERFGEAACVRVDRFLDTVVAESRQQNLVSSNTIADIWVRHALDSAQLLSLVPDDWQTWLDIGTGGGFPGMVVALLAPERAVVMVEPRRKRAEFLQRCVTVFGLDRARVITGRVEIVAVQADVISARAVSSTENLLRAAGQCSTTNTVWLLPRGRSGLDDLTGLRGTGGPMFHVEHSLTDAGSMILVGRGRAT